MINKRIWAAMDSDEAFEILDSTGAKGGDWAEGGCAILAYALLEVFDGSVLYVIYNERRNSIEHFGVKTKQGLVLDSQGVYFGEDEWLESFEKFYTRLNGDGLKVLKYSPELKMTTIVVDPIASKKLVELFKEEV